jgi:Asp-tRNA(Asn)/Glu-tRNA(Gln) amidotransferase A subunit family amidase
MLESGRSFDGALVARAVHQREKLARGFERVLDEVDALIAPTAPLEAPPVGTNRVAIGGFETDLTLALASWTMMHNASRLPTVAVPTGLGGSGLPTSAQISTRPGEEARALALANALEAALWPPAQRWPR